MDDEYNIPPPAGACEKGIMLHNAMVEDIAAIAKVLQGKPAWYIRELLDAIAQSCNHSYHEQIKEMMVSDGKDVA
jgi:hypothetical protein